LGDWGKGEWERERGRMGEWERSEGGGRSGEKDMPSAAGVL